MNCFLFDKRHNQERAIPAEDLQMYFVAIETLTGLDRQTAACILETGRKIDHPSFSFYARAEEVQP
jgi:hypothetical protein